ncbi:hypothetical protein IC007_0135 [Sulfuracidifex tepidarius]|nr:hypothetical protein IC007_0135 [Sulfuracidifex tepidarius]
MLVELQLIEEGIQNNRKNKNKKPSRFDQIMFKLVYIILRN